MGSRAVVVVCRDEKAARERFGVTTGESGIVTTRTGRRFFNDPDLETRFLDRVRAALTAADLWTKLDTAWACLDCELMPWSAKAQELLRTQYAAVGAAGSAALPRAVSGLEEAECSTGGRREGEALPRSRPGSASGSKTSIGSWPPTGSTAGLWRRSPTSSWPRSTCSPPRGMSTRTRIICGTWRPLAEVCRVDPELLLATRYKVVDVTDPTSQEEGIEWWKELTGRGGEGMVVKPLAFIHKGRRGLSQPAVKCRGREYLRIIYGPDYTSEENLSRLRSRGLGRKRSLALGEFALGVEGLERFVRARAAAAGPRVRFRRACPGERAGGPEAMISASVDPDRPRGECARDKREASRGVGGSAIAGA